MFQLSERQARFWCLVLGALAGLAAGAGQLMFGRLNVALIGTIAGALLALLAFLYWRGWDPARLLAVSLFTIAVIGAIEPRQLLDGVVIASIFALLLAGPWWVLAVGGAAAIGLMLRGLLIFGDLSTVVFAEIPVIIMLVGIMAITRFVLEAERRRTQDLVEHAQQAQARSEAQAGELARQTTALAEQNEEQRRLLDLVATLETPAVSIAEGVILAPLIGHLDSRRAASLTTKLLGMAGERRTRMVLLDLSGVPAVDSAVAQSLLRTIQALRLLGCEVSVSGIAAPVATTMAQLGLELNGVRTWRSPQEALEAVREERAGQAVGLPLA